LRFTRSAFLLGLALALGAASGCGRGKDDRSASAPGGVPAQVGENLPVSFRPPPDGLLRKEQVERYVRVLEAAVKVSRPADAPGAAGQGPASALVDEDPLVAPDLAAARRSGFPEEEFLWVRERVLEAEGSAMNARLNADVLAMLEKTLADLHARRSAAADAGSRQLVDEQIAGFEIERARIRTESAEPEPAQVKGNLRILEPHRVRISALQTEIDHSLAALRPQRKGTPAPRP
jgi:hypothetical protein